jgi:hypothetical protein
MNLQGLLVGIRRMVFKFFKGTQTHEQRGEYLDSLSFISADYLCPTTEEFQVRIDNLRFLAESMVLRGNRGGASHVC